MLILKARRSEKNKKRLTLQELSLISDMFCKPLSVEGNRSEFELTKDDLFYSSSLK